jgi:hypothetical protein
MTIRLLPILSAFYITIIGCGNHHYEMYEYEAIRANLKNIEVQGAVRCNSKMNNDTIICGNPYDIYFAIKSKDSTISLNNIGLFYKITGDTIICKPILEPTSVEFEREKRQWIKYYSLIGLRIDHKDIFLRLGYRQHLVDSNLSIPISKKYSKHNVSKIEDYIRAR